jgi:hypothetical protein
MKVTYTTPTGRVQIEMEAPTVKDAFAGVAQLEEVFSEPCCGCCQSANIRPELREFEGNKYYKVLCTDCGATLDLGQYKDVARGLFVKRKSDDGAPMPRRGWYVYGGEPEPAPPAGHPPAGQVVEPVDLRRVRGFLSSSPDAARLNGFFPELAKLQNGTKAAAWALVKEYAASQRFTFDDVARKFK